MKKLIMLFMPKGKTLAGYAADGIAKSVNASKEETRAKVAKVAAYAATATEVANNLAKMVEDGTIDAAETKQLQELMTPLFDKVLSLV